jgi:hypothetical protein
LDEGVVLIEGNYQRIWSGMLIRGKKRQPIRGYRYLDVININLREIDGDVKRITAVHRRFCIKRFPWLHLKLEKYSVAL